MKKKINLLQSFVCTNDMTLLSYCSHTSILTTTTHKTLNNTTKNNKMVHQTYKPSNDRNIVRNAPPSMKDQIDGCYFYPYVVPAILSILCGVGLIAMGVSMKVLDNQLSWKLCHIWTGT